MNRIKDKIKEIEKYLEQLEEITPLEFEEYKKDFKIKLMCERCAEIIIESIIDLAFLVIKEKNLKTPEEEKLVFDILRKENIISEKLSTNLKDAKGMRNIIAHDYGKIDDELVFESLKEQLIPDTEEFIKSIRELL